MFSKTKLFLFFLLIGKVIFSQNNKIFDIETFYLTGEKIYKINKNKNYKIALEFYKKKKYDSSYTYSGKAKLTVINQNEKDFLNYIQGSSAIRKKLYKKALLSINMISNEGCLEYFKYHKLGRVYLEMKEYDKAIGVYSYWEKVNLNNELKKAVYRNLGLCYVHKKEYIKAKEYFKKELSLVEKKDTLAILRSKIDLANIYYNQYLDDEAIPLFKEAYEIGRAHV